MSFIEFGQDGKITGFHLGQPTEIRRLSTNSKVRKFNLHDTCKYYTEWKWYWKENCVKWTEYDVKVTSFCSANMYEPFYFTITITSRNKIHAKISSLKTAEIRVK